MTAWLPMLLACSGAPEPQPTPDAVQPDVAVAAEAPQSDAVARKGPFAVSCGEGLCAIEHEGELITKSIGHHGPAADLIESLGGPVPTPGHAWMIEHYAGDGCPSLYRMLCLVDGEPRITSNFGNCNEPDALTVRDGVHLHFPGWNEPDLTDRPEQEVVLDPMTCSFETR